MSSHDRMRATIQKHGMTEAELVAHMRQAGRCQGREAEMVRKLLDGGACVWGLSYSIIELVVEREHGPSRVLLLPRGPNASPAPVH